MHVTRRFAIEGKMWGIFLSVFVVVISATSFHELIPSRLEGKTRGESIHVVELKAGTPRTTLRLALDFSGTGVTTVMPYSEEISSTYSSAGGGSDEVIISGKRVRLPFTYDPAKVAEKGCSTCEGLLGVGASSPLWIIWKEATFGSGAITLDALAHTVRDAERFNRIEVRAQKRNAIACDVGFSGLCRTQALVGPNRELNTVIFSFESSRTMVPPSVYDAYTSGRNIFDTNRGDWPDMRLEFTTLTNGSKDASLEARIRRHDIVASTSRGDPELLLLPQTDFPNTTFIGRPAWRSFFVFKDWETNAVKVFNWKVEKEFSIYGRFILCISGLLLMWWKGTPSGEWTLVWSFRPIKLIGCFFIAVLSVVTIWVDETRCAMLGFTPVDIYAQIFIYSSILMIAPAILIHMLMWQGYSRRTQWMFEYLMGLTHSEEEAIRLERIEIKPEQPPPASQWIIPSGQHVYANPFLHPAPPHYARGIFHYGLGSQRVWAAINFAFETMLILTTLLVWWSTREDTLAGFGSLMIVSFLLVNTTYHLISQAYHRSGWHNALWYGFLLWMGIFLIATYVLSIYYVFYPFSLRYVPDYGNTPIVITAVFSLALLYLAEQLAATRIPTLFYL